MCLIVDSKNPLIAKRDIPCYKVCFYTEYEPVVVTPYQLAHLRIGTHYEERNNACIKSTVNDYILTSGAYHSFRYLADARRDIKTWGCYDREHMCIVKCIIPKGSKYYVGKFDNCGDICPSYASKQIKLIKKIN